MNGRAHFPVRFGDQLPFEDTVTDANDGLRGFANVLFYWQNELRRNRYFLNRLRCRCTLVSRQTQATMELAKIIGRRAHDRGLIVMQSTGQGATQSSQPVHSLAITVCMN